GGLRILSPSRRGSTNFGAFGPFCRREGLRNLAACAITVGAPTRRHGPQAAVDHDLGGDMSGNAAPTDHLWMPFTRMGRHPDGEVPTIVRGDGAYVWDARGKRYLDGLAGLFVVNAGHGRTEMAEAAAKQAPELAFFPLWS